MNPTPTKMHGPCQSLAGAPCGRVFSNLAAFSTVLQELHALARGCGTAVVELRLIEVTGWG
jgi:hypothetical protein